MVLFRMKPGVRSAFDNAYRRRCGCTRIEFETGLRLEQLVFLFSSFNAAGKHQYHPIKTLG